MNKIEAIREWAELDPYGGGAFKVLFAHIDKLEAENQRLREVAEKVLELADIHTSVELLELATAALRKDGEG